MLEYLKPKMFKIGITYVTLYSDEMAMKNMSMIEGDWEDIVDASFPRGAVMM